jgi:dienelactone hydrolase
VKTVKTNIALTCLLALIALLAVNGELVGLPKKNDTAIVSSLEDGRIGEMRFRSYHPTRQELARGNHRQRPLAVPATLRLPDGIQGRVPAAVLMHGSDGVTKHQQRYARGLRARGMATFVLDSFAPRDVDDTVGRQSAVPAHVMVVDLFAALTLLAGHPRIDADRIAVIGWSKGGVAADWSSREWYRSRLTKGNRQFAAHVAFYAWCGEQEARIELTGAPILYLSGELDDWAGTRACVRYGQRARQADYDVRVVVYPGAHHGFDYDGSFHTYLPRAINWSGCEYLTRETGFVEHPGGNFGAWPDLPGYLSRCSRPGAHVATNAGARDSAWLALNGFLSESLRERVPEAALLPGHNGHLAGAVIDLDQ